jgi:hypothetical protein
MNDVLPLHFTRVAPVADTILNDDNFIWQWNGERDISRPYKSIGFVLKISI